MELAIKELKLSEATSVIDYNGEDPYRMLQVHDYRNIKFLRMNSNVRVASKKTIEVFSTAYPELLKEKFFVNVPVVMGWIYTAMKVLLSPNTTRKFHPITNGVNLAREFPSPVSNMLPKAYGGKGPDLKENGVPVKLDAPAESKSNGASANETGKGTEETGKGAKDTGKESAKDTGKESAKEPTEDLAKELDNEEPVSSEAEAKAVEAGEFPADAGSSATDAEH